MSKDLGPAASASAVILFAFTCQVNVPSLYDELQTRTPETMSAVSVRACFLALTFYVLIGMSGYANFPHTTQGNILNNYCLLDPGKSALSADPPNVILPAFGCLALTVLMAYPINVFPTRTAIEMMCYPKAWVLDTALDAQGGGHESSERGTERCTSPRCFCPSNMPSTSCSARLKRARRGARGPWRCAKHLRPR
jgi:amino acid permease